MSSEQLPVKSEDNPQEEETQEKESQTSSPASAQVAPKQDASATLKTQGLRLSPNGSTEHLTDAANCAARSGRRNDVHEYMRLRRSYV